MADLDKKAQKSQPDLVQSVLDAYEKKNQDRVDMLITNALVQLKGSRFKPDLSVFVGLSYLARLQPKVFSQSANLKETLKGHVKRHGVPANIKGNKTDFFLPVLAANILLATCDTPDVRSTILTRVGQWISSCQKLNELVQHLLATLCVRSNNDPDTIKTLMEMRQHWFEFLESSFSIYGRVSPDLSHAIRSLLSSLTTCESLVENLSFLVKHDTDIAELSSAISKFMVERPLTFRNIMADKDHCEQLINIILNIFEAHIRRNEEKFKSIGEDQKQIDGMIYFTCKNGSQILVLDEIMIRAFLSLLSDYHSLKIDEAPHLLSFLNDWVSTAKSGSEKANSVFLDSSLKDPYIFPTKLLIQMLSQKRDDIPLRELAIYNATPVQILELTFTFGQEPQTIDDLMDRLEDLGINDIGSSSIRECSYFNELLDHFSETGSKHVNRFRERLNNVDLQDPMDCKNIEPPVDVKIKKEIPQ